jgi:hypothetical protein
MNDSGKDTEFSNSYFNWRPWYAWYPVRLTHGADGYSNVMLSRPCKWAFGRRIQRARTMREGYHPMPFVPLPAYRDAPTKAMP